MRFPTPVVLLAALVLPGAALGQQGERYTLTDSDVAIYNLAGTVTIEPGSGSVSVQVTRGGADAARLTVAQGEIDGRETLRILYPAEQVVYQAMERGSSTRTKVREDGTFGDGDHHGGHGRRSDRHEDGRPVRISGSGDGLAAHADLRVRLPSGQEAAIYLAVGKVSVANIDGRLRIDAHSAAVSANAIKGALSVDVGSGAVNVTGAEGELSVDTGSGGVEVSRFRGTELSVDTGSGEVTAAELRATAVAIETGSGDIRLSAASAPTLSLETGSGSVTADLQGAPQSLSVETGSGDISVTAPGSLGAEVEIETASGEIETDFPLQITRHSRDHLVGRIGDGKGRIAIETGSGDIRLLRKQG